MIVRLVQLECGHDRLASETTLSKLPKKPGEMFMLASYERDLVGHQPLIKSSLGSVILSRVVKHTEVRTANSRETYLRIETMNSTLSLIVVAVLDV